MAEIVDLFYRKNLESRFGVNIYFTNLLKLYARTWGIIRPNPNICAIVLLNGEKKTDFASIFFVAKY
jgi:hypothetical protein